MSEVLRFRDVGLVTGRARTLDTITFGIRPGERRAIVGGNGSGKSALACLAIGLLTATEGSIALFGSPVADAAQEDLRALRARTGVVLQGGSLLGGLSVEDNLRLGLGPTGAATAARVKRRIDRLLLEFNLEHLYTRPVELLSTGERRRVELARAFLRDPDLLILDDPFDGIDRETADDLERRTLRLLSRRARALLLLTRDRTLAERSGAVVVALEQGRLVETPAAGRA